MRTPLIALIAAVVALAPARAEEITPETLEIVKRAAVFIKVSSKKVRTTGSGFVITTQKGHTFVATNHHVVTPNDSNQSRMAWREPRDYKDVSVTVVLDSGTPDERASEAEVVAVDPANDLAVLSVANLKNPPRPLEWAAPVKLVETTPVYSFGFPFGNMLATSNGSPAVTVGKASISSLRQAENGELAIIQIDGALNPGNSGGPVVDSRGRLVGVAVATIKNSSGIGLIIPAADLNRLLQGRPGICKLSVNKNAEGQPVLRADVPLSDPLSRITGVTFYWVRPRSALDSLRTDELLERRDGCQSIQVKPGSSLAASELNIDGSLEGELYVQVVATDYTRRRVVMPPGLYRVSPRSALGPIITSKR